MAIGVDEAGRGPVLGPLVVAAVQCPDDAVLRALGVDDSKRLSPGTRERLARTICDEHPTGVRMASASEIDSWREHRSLNALEVKLFAEAVRDLTTGAGAGHPDRSGGDGATRWVVDPVAEVLQLDAADVDEERFGMSVRSALSEMGIRVGGVASRHKGDSIFPAVSAASVVAKVRRDREVARIEAEAGQAVGSGYPSDPVTVEYIRSYAAQNGKLPPHTRGSWETARRILEEVTVRKPGLFEFGDG